MSAAERRRWAAMRPRILCVDDEPQVLDGLRDALRRSYDVQVALGAHEALELLKEGGFALVISDMRMPGMSGAVLLREARRVAPLTVRMLLTGYADADAAARAVNEGQVFRFLQKPCSGEALQSACAAAVGHHRMLLAESVVVAHALDDVASAGAELLELAPAELAAPAARLHDALARLASARAREDR